MTIEESVPGQTVGVKLEFVKPMALEPRKNVML
jgi:hypothetical protein